MRILGIDPGSRMTGFGIIDARHQSYRHVASGVIALKDRAIPERLKQIYEDLVALIHTHQPTALAIEQVFVHKNASSALKLGHARGVAIAAGMVQGLEVFEYSAKQIKLATVGYGAAAKQQMQHMVKVLLTLNGTPQSDEADALAVAICHAHAHHGSPLSRALAQKEV